MPVNYRSQGKVINFLDPAPGPTKIFTENASDLFTGILELMRQVSVVEIDSVAKPPRTALERILGEDLV